MATIRYNIDLGTPPFTASINPAVAGDNLHLGVGSFYFTDIPDGDYIISVSDSAGCHTEFNVSVICEVTTTTSTTTVEDITTTTTTTTVEEVTTTTSTTTEPLTTTTTTTTVEDITTTTTTTTVEPSTTTTTTTVVEPTTTTTTTTLEVITTTTTSTTVEDITTTTTTTIEVITTTSTTVEPTTTTTTTTVIISLDTCDMMLSGQDNVVLYSVSPPKNEALLVPGYVQGNDIASTANKLWVIGDSTWNETDGFGNEVHEYNITYSPFTAVFSRTIQIPVYLGQGLAAIDDNTLIVTEVQNADPANGASKVYTADITTINAVLTHKFDLEYEFNVKHYIVSGDFLLTTGVNPKWIVTIENDKWVSGDERYWICQYDWNTGVIEIKKAITSYTRPYGLAVQNNKLYVFNAIPTVNGETDVYEIPLTYPYEPIFIEKILGIFTSGATQQPSCIDVEMIPHIPTTTTTTTTVEVTTTTTTTIEPITTTTTTTVEVTTTTTTTFECNLTYIFEYNFETTTTTTTSEPTTTTTSTTVIEIQGEWVDYICITEATTTTTTTAIPTTTTTTTVIPTTTTTTTVIGIEGEWVDYVCIIELTTTTTTTLEPTTTTTTVEPTTTTTTTTVIGYQGEWIDYECIIIPTTTTTSTTIEITTTTTTTILTGIGYMIVGSTFIVT
jgi:hypothetical protein